LSRASQFGRNWLGAGNNFRLFLFFILVFFFLFFLFNCSFGANYGQWGGFLKNWG
jgi:hypothetical protein